MLVDSLVKLNSSSRNAIFAALTAIAAIAMYNWIVAPHVTYLFAVQQYEPVVGDIVEENKIISDSLRSKEKKLEELREQFAQLRSSLFTSDETKEFFSSLKTIAEEAGCTVSSLNFTASRPDSVAKRSEDTSRIVANSAMLSVIGGYDNIVRLVERLQGRTQKVWVKSVKMKIFDVNSARLKCDITITMYTIQDEETALNE